jgi:hypothetical protein
LRNYNARRRHGGSGVVVSWGCAADVVRLCARPGLEPRSLPPALAHGLPPLVVDMLQARL